MGHTNKNVTTISLARMGALALAAATVLLLGACGEKKEGGTQVAAKVNGDEITVHQINLALQQQRNLRPEQVDSASRQLLDQLIDQQIDVQQAEKLKLDREPLTVQMIEAARREILARRYLETIAQGAGKPSAADVQNYFAAHPALFSDRRIYKFQRIDVPVAPERRADVVARAKSAHSTAEMVDCLKAQGLAANVTPTSQPAEALPLQIIDRLAAAKEGDSIVLPQQLGVSILMLESSQPAPKTLDESRAAIEQFLAVQTRRDAVAATSKSLRADAKVEYEGKYAASAPVAGGASAAAASAPVSDPAPAASAASDARALSNGLGLK